MPGFLAGAATWGMLSTGNDGSIVEGADKLPYALENISVGYHTAEEPVPVGFWRSVGHSSNAFVVETFFDELLAKAKLDPVEARRTLLKEHPRHLGVLETVARAARWGTPVAEGRGRGIAVHESFDSYVAVVAEVSVERSEIRVHKLTGAVDCGLALNPDAVRAQIMGGMVFALSPALTQQAITYKDGRVQQSNFHDFQSLRMSASPEVEVHIVDSTEAPTGVGEPGVPPTAAAVANAVAALTGKRLRKMPFDLA
ncbi:MAG: molybdopterin cofactor-binding domain-containing protein [Myxococcota bacterium]